MISHFIKPYRGKLTTLFVKYQLSTIENIKKNTFGSKDYRNTREKSDKRDYL